LFLEKACPTEKGGGGSFPVAQYPRNKGGEKEKSRLRHASQQLERGETRVSTKLRAEKGREKGKKRPTFTGKGKKKKSDCVKLYARRKGKGVLSSSGKKGAQALFPYPCKGKKKKCPRLARATKKGKPEHCLAFLKTGRKVYYWGKSTRTLFFEGETTKRGS